MTTMARGRALDAMPTPGFGALGDRAAGHGLLAALALCVLAALVRRYDAPAVLLAAAVALPATLLLLRPELATLLTVFLLYLNVPGILVKRHGVPVAVAGALVLLLGIPLLRALVVRREPLRVDATLRLMLGFLGVVLLSALAARDPALVLEYARRFVMEGVLVYLLLVNAIRTMPALRRAIWTALAAGSLLGALTTYQELTGTFRREFGGLAERNHEILALRAQGASDPDARAMLRDFMARNAKARANARANGPMDEPNRFAQILVPLLPLALMAFRLGRRRAARAAAVAAALLVASGIFLADSRGAFVTVVVLAIVAGGIRWISRPWLLGAAVAGLLLVPVAAPKFAGRVASIAGATSIVSGGAAPDGAVLGRAAAMRAAAHAALDHPLLGVGAGQFKPFHSREYQLEDVTSPFRYVKDWYAHSLYLELAAELGVVGLAAFLLVFVRLLRALDRARRRWRISRPDVAHVATGLELCILGYLGTSAFLHLGFQRYLWLLTALAGAALHVFRAIEAAESRAVAR